MALIKFKPTSPGTRAVVKIDRSHLYKGGPYLPTPLLEGEVWRPVGEQRPEAQVGDRSIPGLLRREGRVVNDWITITRQSVAHLALVLTSRPPSAGRNPSTCSMWRGATGARSGL